MTFRKTWVSIPPQLMHRKKEILGETRGDQMQDCLYNSLIAGWYTPAPTIDNVQSFLWNLSDIPKLKDYQLDDLARSLGRRYVFNINKPGYGKTLETIIWMRVNLQRDFKVLILCPKSVIETSWIPQLNKYWPGWQSAGMFWITNYEQLYNEGRFKLACEFVWDLIVLDESHTIKSFKSKITQRVFKLRSSARHCLTGTPVKNRPEDLAAQLKWLDPSSITNFTEFQLAFCNVERTAWGWQARGLTKDATQIENLQKLLAVYCVGGQEHDIGVNGEPERIKVRIKLDPKVEKLYRKTVGEYDAETHKRTIDTVSLLEAGVKISNAIEAATRRQQIASNPQLFDPQLTNVKFDWIVNWLRGTDEKVVIMSKFAKTIDALELRLTQEKLGFVAIKRGSTASERNTKLAQWHARPKYQALLGTFGILGTGVDGLQDSCRYEIHIDRNWTSSDNEQAESRIYRTGQGGKVVIYILQAIGTIDVQIERVQYQKGQDALLLLQPVSEED